MPVPTTQGLHRRPLLRDHAYDSLRDAIVDGTLAPGERLRDSELESWLGVSRTPIREALLRLERARLVVAQPGRFTVVAPVDLESTISSQQIAASIHELAARLATPHLTAEDLERLEAANARFAEAISNRTVVEAIEADDDFHGVFVTRSGNPIIPELLERVVPVLRRVERLRFATVDSSVSVVRHASIIAHARAGNAEAAGQDSRENWLSLRYTFDD